MNKPQKPLSPAFQKERSVAKSVSQNLGAPLPPPRLGGLPIESDLGLMGPYPNIISGDNINMNGPDAAGIWDQQYSHGGSILDSLLDAVEEPAPKMKATPPPPPAGLKVKVQQDPQDGVGEGQKFFRDYPLLAGYMFGVLLFYILNEKL